MSVNLNVVNVTNFTYQNTECTILGALDKYQSLLLVAVVIVNPTAPEGSRHPNASQGYSKPQMKRLCFDVIINTCM